MLALVLAAGAAFVWLVGTESGLRFVLERAQAERRLVVTFDKDFGELAFRHGLPAECGIILFRIPTSTPERVADAAVKALESTLDFAGHFVVVEDTRVRSTPLPNR